MDKTETLTWAEFFSDTDVTAMMLKAVEEDGEKAHANHA